MWVTFASGYSAVYQALVIVCAGIVLYAFIKARMRSQISSGRVAEVSLAAVVDGGAGSPVRQGARLGRRLGPGSGVGSRQIGSERLVTPDTRPG